MDGLGTCELGENVSKEFIFIYLGRFGLHLFVAFITNAVSVFILVLAIVIIILLAVTSGESKDHNENEKKC